MATREERRKILENTIFSILRDDPDADRFEIAHMVMEALDKLAPETIPETLLDQMFRNLREIYGAEITLEYVKDSAYELLDADVRPSGGPQGFIAEWLNKAGLRPRGLG